MDAGIQWSYKEIEIVNGESGRMADISGRVSTTQLMLPRPEM
jgi:hypothetical protein